MVFKPPAVAAPDNGNEPRVVDGDTVHLGKDCIILLGIDTPETHRSCCSAERLDGEIANNALKQLLAGQMVEIECPGQHRYRRMLATLSVAGRDVGDQMIPGGYAVEWNPGSKTHSPRLRLRYRL